MVQRFFGVLDQQNLGFACLWVMAENDAAGRRLTDHLVYRRTAFVYEVPESLDRLRTRDEPLAILLFVFFHNMP